MRYITIILAIAFTSCERRAVPETSPTHEPMYNIHTIDHGFSSSTVKCIDTETGSMWWVKYGEGLDMERSPDPCPTPRR